MKNPNVHTQKEIRNAIKWGLAKNVSNADPKEFKGHKFNKIWVSKGVYGMNGGLVKDLTTGEYLAVIGRTSMLFWLF